MLDWTNKDSFITPHFTVHEATWLPSWGVYHKPSEEEKTNILKHAETMEKVREYLGGNAININCWIRPVIVNCDNPRYNGKDYNRIVGGTAGSAHIVGLACDFTVSRITCDDVRHLLQEILTAFSLRMEKKVGGGWVHLDSRQPLPGQSRYFLP